MARAFNIQIDQGTSYSEDLDMLDDSNAVINLTGYTVNAIAKRYYGYTNSWSFATQINAVAGIINLSLSAAASANIVAGRYVYNVVITDAANTVTRLLEGIVTINPQV
jgi:hypothetical protein